MESTHSIWSPYGNYRGVLSTPNGDDLFNLDDDDAVCMLALLLNMVLAVVTALHIDPAFFFFMLPSIIGC